MNLNKLIITAGTSSPTSNITATITKLYDNAW